MMERIYASMLYLDKLQSAMLYKEAARMLKEFSDVIYERYAEFSAQDTVHAVSLHGMMNALMIKNPSVSAEIRIVPDIIEGVGIRRQEEEEAKNFDLAKMWIDKFKIIESRIGHILKGVEENCQELIDFSQEYISLTGLKVISEDRLSVLEDLRNKITATKCQLFNRSDENQIWKCLNCGMTSVGPEAPAECPCCLAPQGTQGAGDWRIP